VGDYISISRAIACAARDPKLSPSWVDFGLPTVAWRYLKLNFLCQSCHLTWGYWAFLPANLCARGRFLGPKGCFFQDANRNANPVYPSVSACLSPLLSFSSHPNLEKKYSEKHAKCSAEFLRITPLLSPVLPRPSADDNNVLKETWVNCHQEQLSTGNRSSRLCQVTMLSIRVFRQETHPLRQAARFSPNTGLGPRFRPNTGPT